VEFNKQIELSKKDKIALLTLWNKEYPSKLSHEDIEEFETYLDGLEKPSHVLIKNKNGDIQGWYCDFYREKEKWFLIILDSKIHGQGFGTRILNQAKEKESELNAWVNDQHKDKKSDGEYYRSPLEFYLNNGFKKLEERIELTKISAVKIRWRKDSVSN